MRRDCHHDERPWRCRGCWLVREEGPPAAPRAGRAGLSKMAATTHAAAPSGVGFHGTKRGWSSLHERRHLVGTAPGIASSPKTARDGGGMAADTRLCFHSTSRPLRQASSTASVTLGSKAYFTNGATAMSRAVLDGLGVRYHQVRNPRGCGSNPQLCTYLAIYTCHATVFHVRIYLPPVTQRPSQKTKQKEPRTPLHRTFSNITWYLYEPHQPHNTKVLLPRLNELAEARQIETPFPTKK